MCTRKRTLVAWGMAVASLAFLVGVLGMPKTTRPADARVDWCKRIQQYTDAFNRGEIDLALKDFADDMVFVGGPACSPKECVGKDAYRNYVEYLVALPTQLTIVSCEISGNTIAATYEVRGRHEEAAGVDRIITSQTNEFEGDTLVSERLVGIDMQDSQTAKWYRWWSGTALFNFAMGPGRDADQSPGVVVLERYPNWSAVNVRIKTGPTGVRQPVNIHEGTCADLGPVAFALTDMAGGVSQTVLEDVPGSDLQTGNLAIAVQKSHYEPDVYVACADIPAAAAAVPPAEPVPAPVATGFADANGAHLYYEVYGKGEPLLLIPTLINHLCWAEHVPVYANEFKVIVYDPRGTGQSSFPEGVQLTTALLADDAAALLDALGIDAAHVQGWSLGGMVAQEMALRHPEKIRSLILSATSPGGPHAAPVEDSVLAALIAGMTQGVTAPNFLESWFSSGYLAEHRSEAIEHLHWQPDPETPIQVLQAELGAAARHDTYDRLPSITAPTLVLHGTDDRLLPVQDGRILAERIPGAELILFEGAGHSYMLEKQAEADAAVLDFLRRHQGQVAVPSALPATGSGGLLGEEGSSLPTWWYALAAGGTLLIMGGLAGQWRARRRR